MEACIFYWFMGIFVALPLAAVMVYIRNNTDDYTKRQLHKQHLEEEKHNVELLP